MSPLLVALLFALSLVGFVSAWRVANSPIDMETKDED